MIDLGPPPSEPTHVAFESLPEDMQELLADMIVGHDGMRDPGAIPTLFPLVEVALGRLPPIDMRGSDRGEAYARDIDIDRAPPIVIAGDQMMDGCHRTWKARRDMRESIRAIDIADSVKPEMVARWAIGTIEKDIAYDCQACGACCVEAGWVPVSPDEAVPAHLTRAIPTRLEAHDDLPEGTREMAQHIGGRCVALAGEIGHCVSCTIHPRRPRACREFDAGSPGCLAARDRARAKIAWGRGAGRGYGPEWESTLA